MTTHLKREYTPEEILLAANALNAYSHSTDYVEHIQNAEQILRFLASSRAAQKREGHAWCDASIPPDVPEGRDAYFWIAVRRKDSDKVVTFPAVYANAYPLCSEDPDDAEGAHWSQVVVDYDEVGANILATGWYDIKVGDGDYDQEYQPVCSNGDAIVAWCRAPGFVLANQPPSPDQDREVSP